MLTYPMEERGDLPLYEYLYRRIREDILSGKLTAGERLPSKRALAEHLHLSVITVEGAYAQLEAEGRATPSAGQAAPAEDQLSLGDMAGAEVLDALRATAVETLTPIEALNLLYQLKQKL